jgi:hypothetical protein
MSTAYGAAGEPDKRDIRIKRLLKALDTIVAHCLGYLDGKGSIAMIHKVAVEAIRDDDEQAVKP